MRWRWRPTVLIALLFTVGATVYVETLPSQYDGKTLVAVGPRAGSGAGSDDVRVIAPKYVEQQTFVRFRQLLREFLVVEHIQGNGGGFKLEPRNLVVQAQFD